MYRIKNWNKFQHYKDRKPPWIKLHVGLLNDYEYLALSPKAKLVLIHCWMAAAELWEPSKEVEPLLPSESFLIRSRVVLKGKLFLHEIVEKGFLIRVPSNYNNLIKVDASKTVAEPYQSATPEYRVQSTKKENTKRKYLDKVFLKPEEHEKLIERLGKTETENWIEELDGWIASKGVKYKCHYQTILNWDRKEKKKTKAKQPTGKTIEPYPEVQHLMDEDKHE